MALPKRSQIVHSARDEHLPIARATDRGAGQTDVQRRRVRSFATAEDRRARRRLIEVDQLLERHEVGAVAVAGGKAMPACSSS